ncbi:MAG: 7TMR-DISMED2 domain-containing protein, partial [Marinobacterium sp.]
MVRVFVIFIQLFSLSLILSSNAHAADEIWLFEDTTGTKTYDEVMANPHWFEPTTDTSRGFSDSVFWIKQTLTNPFAKPLTQVVQFDSLRLPLVEEFLKVEPGTRLRSNG